MRMDIENSPGAALEPRLVLPRDNWGLAAGILAGSHGAMTGKRVCSARHPAAVRRGRRFTEVRMKGVL
jgi:hypothetical protein